MLPKFACRGDIGPRATPMRARRLFQAPVGSDHSVDEAPSLRCQVGRFRQLPERDRDLFAAPGEPALDLDSWVKYWKSQFRKGHADKSLRWQTDHWDLRLRNGESYEAKWNYVRKNPVRAGLVERVEDWPYQGKLFELRWS